MSASAAAGDGEAWMHVAATSTIYAKHSSGQIDHQDWVIGDHEHTDPVIEAIAGSVRFSLDGAACYGDEDHERD